MKSRHLLILFILLFTPSLASAETSLTEDVDTIIYEQGWLGYASLVGLGVESGVVLSKADASGEAPAPVGTSNIIPVRAWGRLSVPILRTRYGWGVGLDTQHTAGTSLIITPNDDGVGSDEPILSRPQEGQRLTWSSMALMTLMAGGDDRGFALQAGTEIEKGTPYWWRAPSERTTHAVLGARAIFVGDDRPFEFGYHYAPQLSTPSRNVALNRGAAGAPSHSAHRLWFMNDFVRVRYTLHHIVFFDSDFNQRDHEVTILFKVPLFGGAFDDL